MSKSISTKEALILLLDVGTSMTPYLQSFVDIIQMIIQRKMFQSSKDDVALIIFGCNETLNDLSKGNACAGVKYNHIAVIQPLIEVDWNLLDYVQNRLRTTNLQGDLFEALTVATDHLYEESKIKKYSDKRIIMLTDFSGRSQNDLISELKDGLAAQEIRFDVITPFNDESKELTQIQVRNRECLEKIVEATDGAIYTHSEVLTILSTYEAKAIKSAGTKYEFKIGESLTIPIVSLIKVKENKPELFKFKKVYAKDESVDLVIEHARLTKDDEQRDLSDKSEIIDAYKYGSSYIPIDNADKLKYQVEKCFTLLGFTKSENVKRHHFLGDNVSEIVADVSKCDENAKIAFVAMIEAMYEENVYGIVRKVFNSRSTPELGCLIPYIQKDSTSFLYLELPYDDDMRKFTLENFCSSKKYTPSDRQLELVDNLIESMDLSLANDNASDDEHEEPYNPHVTFNPYVQRMFQSIALRATNPNAELPNFAQHITSTLNRKYDAKIRGERTNEILKRVKEEFPLQINDLKRQKIVDEREMLIKSSQSDTNTNIVVHDSNELKIDDLHSLVTNDLLKNKKIGTVNPSSDFVALVEALPSDFDEFVGQLCDLIRKFTHLIVQADDENELQIRKIISCLESLRETCLKHDKVSFFNCFLIDFKQYLFESNEFKYFKKETQSLWTKLSTTLISYDESDLSDVNSDDAKKFLEMKIEAKMVNKIVENAHGIKDEENVEDLLDLI